jgi:glyoxylase-like metal-dependent hydrolase (beta-lactamase superfamily II)
MQQIAPNLYVIDEIGDMVHCYVWEWAQGITLIDAGMPVDGPKILAALKSRGRPLHSVKRLIVTHGDVDHVGGAAHIVRAARAPVACHTVEKELLEHPGRRKPRPWLLRPFAAFARLFPALRAQPVAPDELLVDGQELPEGFIVVHTPGHTPGHISLLHRQQRILIAGDALSNRKGKLAAPSNNPFTTDPTICLRSVWKLAKKHGDDFDVVVFGHGEPILNNGGAKVKALASQIYSSEV